MAIALAVVLAACDTDPADGPQAPDATDPIAPTTGNDGTRAPRSNPDRPGIRPPEPVPVAPVRGSAERTVPWQAITAGPGDRRLLLDVRVGGPPCDAVTAVKVQEGRRAVTVTVLAGRVRGARCGPGVPAVLGTFRVEVQLEHPLGSRRLVDGGRP